jgi:hypothetical protein
VTEGSATVSGAVATFVDPAAAQETDGAADDYGATIDWGDGSVSTGTVTPGPGGVFTVSGTHTYTGETIGGESEGIATVRTAITHESLAPVTATTSVNITDPNVTATGGFSLTAAEGSASISGAVATVTDPGNPTGTAEDGADYSASISWGDGSVSTGSITEAGGTFTVTGSHTYLGDTIGGESEGTATVTTAITHDGLAPVTAATTVSIADAPLTSVTGVALGSVTEEWHLVLV